MDKHEERAREITDRYGMLTRRRLLTTGAAALVAAPAIVRAQGFSIPTSYYLFGSEARASAALTGFSSGSWTFLGSAASASSVNLAYDRPVRIESAALHVIWQAEYSMLWLRANVNGNVVPLKYVPRLNPTAGPITDGGDITVEMQDLAALRLACSVHFILAGIIPALYTVRLDVVYGT